MNGNQRYPDLRYMFIRSFIDHEGKQRKHHWMKSAAEWISKAIVSLELSEEPIKSVEQAKGLVFGIGEEAKKFLKKTFQEKRYRVEAPPKGYYLSTGAGFLVALLNASDGPAYKNFRDSNSNVLLTEQQLKYETSKITEESFNIKDNALAIARTGEPVFCCAWWRLQVLKSRDLIKQRTRAKIPVYELLPAGREIALRLRGTAPLPAHPSMASISTETTQGHADTQEAADHAGPMAGSLYGNDDGRDGIILLVDQQELGGDRVRLLQLSRDLTRWNVVHKTRSLPTGDYWWIWRKNGIEYPLPLIAERKRADDLAHSLKDGRFYKQQEKMLNWRESFGPKKDTVALKYIVESDPIAYQVRCGDACGGVGKCGNPTVEQVQIAIGEIDRSDNFDLIKTMNVEVTVELLVGITDDFRRRTSDGEFAWLLNAKGLPDYKSDKLQYKTKPIPKRGKKTAAKKTNNCTVSKPSSTVTSQEAPREGDWNEGMFSKTGRDLNNEGIQMPIYGLDDKAASARNKTSPDYSPRRKRRKYSAINIEDFLEPEEMEISRNKDVSRFGIAFTDSQSDSDDGIELLPNLEQLKQHQGISRKSKLGHRDWSEYSDVNTCSDSGLEHDLISDTETGFSHRKIIKGACQLSGSGSGSGSGVDIKGSIFIDSETGYTSHKKLKINSDQLVYNTPHLEDRSLLSNTKTRYPVQDLGGAGLTSVSKDAVELVRTVLPDVSESLIIATLKSFSDDAERAISYLLDTQVETRNGSEEICIDLTD